jgi:hypothetical protein
MVLSSIGIKRLAAATVIQARMRGNFARYKRQAAATEIQAKRMQCDAAWAEVQACIRVQRMWRAKAEAIRKHRQAAKIQARMRGCFAREKLESDVRREITHEHPWNPRVPSMRLQVLRSNERRMLKMRQHIKLSMPITYAAATAARKRQFLRRCGGDRECTQM